MIWQIDLLMLSLLLLSGIALVAVRSMVATVAVSAAFSLFAALLFAGMGAPDVAFVEAVLGSAFVGVLLLAAVLKLGDERVRFERRAVLVATPIVLAFAALMLVASSDLPDRGDASAPAHRRVSPEFVERSLDETKTPNVVTAVLADYRSLDTLGETVVVFTAALSVLVILRRRESST